MKKRNFLYLAACLMMTLTVFSGCSKEEKKDSVNLSKEFQLEYVEAPDFSEKIENLYFDEAVSVGKVSSLSWDTSGSSLGYSLKEGELEKLIKLLQDEAISGIAVSKKDYQVAMKGAVSGLIIEFKDSTDRFLNGIARITCITEPDKYYLNMIAKGEDSKIYQIALPKSAIAFLNEKSEENYSQSSDNPGWFDKAFKKEK